MDLGPLHICNSCGTPDPGSGDRLTGLCLWISSLNWAVFIFLFIYFVVRFCLFVFVVVLFRSMLFFDHVSQASLKLPVYLRITLNSDTPASEYWECNYAQQPTQC